MVIELMIFAGQESVDQVIGEVPERRKGAILCVEFLD